MHPSLLLGLAAVATAKVTFNTNLPEYGFNGKLSADAVSEECAKAYSTELNCSENLYAFRNDTLGPELISKKSLTDFCTDECIDDLNAWDNAVRKACSKDDLLKLEKRSDADVPEYYKMVLRGMHEVQEHLYWPFCIQDQYVSPLPPPFFHSQQQLLTPQLQDHQGLLSPQVSPRLPPRRCHVPRSHR